MNNRFIAKLKSRAGETIGETLLALLISSLALVMLAGAISASANMVNASSAKMTEYYQQDAELAERSGSDTVSVTIAEKTGGSGSVTQTYNVPFTVNDAFSSMPVVAYGKS